MTLKLGFFLPQSKQFDPQTDIPEAARAAEDIGYDSIWAFERVLYAKDQTGIHQLTAYGDGSWPQIYRSVADLLITLAMAAAVTNRVKLGTAVLLRPLHMPFRLAKTLATLSAVSGGRLIAGLGLGWSIDEHMATGPRPLHQRGAAMEEFLDMANALWKDDPVSFENERYTVLPAEVGPKPTQPIPILLGGWSDPTLDRVARRASGWLPSMVPPADLAASLQKVRDKAADYGRDPKEIRCTTVVALRDLRELPEAQRAPYTGSIDQIVSDLADLAEAGADEVVLTLTHVSRDVEELKDLAAQFHAGVKNG